MAARSKEARRGAPLTLQGVVEADGEACGHVGVEFLVRSGAGETPIGMLATDERGHYDGAIVLPKTLAVGDYEIVARTAGDGRCGRGWSR
jgi:hypothetical protein